MEEHLGYQKYARSDDVYDDNYRNGTEKNIHFLWRIWYWDTTR